MGQKVSALYLACIITAIPTSQVSRAICCCCKDPVEQDESERGLMNGSDSESEGKAVSPSCPVAPASLAALQTSADTDANPLSQEDMREASAKAAEKRANDNKYRGVQNKKRCVVSRSSALYSSCECRCEGQCRPEAGRGESQERSQSQRKQR